MSENQEETSEHSPSPKTTLQPEIKKAGCLKTLGLILLTVITTVVITYWVMTTYLFPKSFTPVSLKEKEKSVLVKKLRKFGIQTSFDDESHSPEPPLEPEPYSEANAKREVLFTERELNAILAKNTDMASKLAIDLADNLASAKLLLPLDPDFPFLGGKTLKASAGITLSYENERPIVILRGVSVWGVPIPNAWLGGLKNVDLIKEFGDQAGFWKSFAEGIENIKVEEEHLVIKLKE